MKKNDKILSLLVVVLLAGFAYYRFLHPEKKDPVMDEKNKIVFDEIFSSVLNGGEPEFLVLLSLKYGVDLEKVKNITYEFSPKAYADKMKSLMNLKSMEEIKKYKQHGSIQRTLDKIGELSTMTNVDKKTIASIIIDYKALNNVGFQQETSEYEDDTPYESDHDAGRF